MKKIILTLTAIFICTIAYAHTINWWDEDRATLLETTTCDSGESITPPTTPYKYGYHFVKWAEYTPIEYLESTGTQWIDTGVLLEPDAKLEVKFRVVEAPKTMEQWTVIYQSRGENDNVPHVRDIGCVQYGRFLTNADSGLARPNMPLHTVGIDYIEYMTPDGWTINNVYYARAGSPRILSTPATLQLIHTSGIVRLYYFKIWNNDVLVRDFIPVLDKDGTPCMYDRVEGKFYYNAGTGQFVAGPVIGGD